MGVSSGTEVSTSWTEMNIKLCYCVDATVLEEEEKLIDLLTYLFLLLRTL